MAKWEEEDRRTIALRGDVIAIALRPSPLLFAGSSSYLEILLGTFNNSVETDATWRHGGRRLFRGKKEKRGKKKKLKLVLTRGWNTSRFAKQKQVEEGRD